MYNIKNGLTFEQCMEYLNELHEYVIEYDISCGEVDYIVIDFTKETKQIIDLLLNNIEDYYDENIYENTGEIDIVKLYMLICEKFNKNIYYSDKKGFYIKSKYINLIDEISKIKTKLNSIKLYLAKKQLKTITEWGKFFKIEILNFNGFDKNLHNKKITYNEFINVYLKSIVKDNIHE